MFKTNNLFMLDNNDLQAIGQLIGERLKTQEDNITKRFDEKIDEVLAAVNDGFTDMQKEFDALKEEVKLRPTKQEIFSWGDKQIVELQLRTDKLDYLHLDELDKLPPQTDISRTLVKRGYKEIKVQEK